ncbi:nucleotide pyrophosphohydrolase [Lacticaseibacillus nasuensis]|uniref:nucleotide pyrophosphohydrolase n=1 Tax=Lacticaseibacillus nasuensis TaxID=944671 RepID=UPI00224724AC|nr:nucleotide pyrophosphohydrolase [Lacticaseibacillus nasuensis]MCX2454947.1 nucleotide pyrophosphohydrolase [Lacticaseibacillus nasuensis]
MDTQQVIHDLVAFRDDRGWQDFHTLTALSRALGIEASEVEKVFLWKTTDAELSEQDRHDLAFELADVLTYAYYMCEKLGVDPNKIVEAKLAQNQERHWKFEEQ